MRRIADLIRAHLRLRVFLPLLVAALACTAYGLGPSLERFAELSGGQRLVDLQPRLQANELIEQVKGYTPETVRFYVGWSAFDYAWPLLTFTTMLFMTAWLLRFLSPRWQALFPAVVAAAYTTVLMDWGENAGFVSVMLSDDPQPLVLAKIAVLLHRGKLLFNFVFNALFFTILGAVLIGALRKRLNPGAR